MYKGKTAILFKIILIIYFLLLSRLILFRYPLYTLIMSAQSDSHLIPASINLTPFKTIFIYLKGAPYLNIALKNLIGNIVIFFPFGFLVPLMTDRVNSYIKIALCSAGLSLLFESAQLILRVGSFDVDDLLLNTLGGILGYMILKLIKKIRIKKFVKKGK